MLNRVKDSFLYYYLTKKDIQSDSIDFLLSVHNIWCMAMVELDLAGLACTQAFSHVSITSHRSSE